MKKKVWLAMALSAAMAVGAPMASYAVQVKVVQVCPDGSYQVLGGEDDECVQQILSQLDSIIGNIGNFCQAVPGGNVTETEEPETEAPQTEAPQTEAPQTEVPETEMPQTEAPQTEAPETEAPETEALQTEAPETEAPQTEAPETEAPQTEAPETETPEMNAPVLTYAEQITRLVNAERSKAGLPAVELRADITAAANTRAMESKRQFAHTRPDGRSFSTALTDRGISFWGCGENIAYGQRSPEEVMEGWMNSPGHRANILNRNYKYIGVGHYQDERGVNYWSQLFIY